MPQIGFCCYCCILKRKKTNQPNKAPCPSDRNDDKNSPNPSNRGNDKHGIIQESIIHFEFTTEISAQIDVRTILQAQTPAFLCSSGSRRVIQWTTECLLKAGRSRGKGANGNQCSVFCLSCFQSTTLRNLH